MTAMIYCQELVDGVILGKSFCTSMDASLDRMDSLDLSVRTRGSVEGLKVDWALLWLIALSHEDGDDVPLLPLPALYPSSTTHRMYWI